MGQNLSASGPTETATPDIVLTNKVQERLLNSLNYSYVNTMREPELVQSTGEDEEEKEDDEEPKNSTDTAKESKEDAKEDTPAIADPDSEMTKNKDYWKQRLDNMKAMQEKILQTLETERQQGYKDVEGTLADSESKEEVQACVENRDLVKKCYQENSKEPLICDQEVKTFVTCVKSKRLEAHAAKTEEEST